MPRQSKADITRPLPLVRVCGLASILGAGLLSAGVLGSSVASAQVINVLNAPKVVGEPEPVVERIEDPAKLKQAFDQIVTDLSSNDFAVRHAASDRLDINDQFDLAMLETALKRVDLTLEAKSRLMSAARNRFFRSPRAALGFQFGGPQLRDRIIVGKTFEKFPAFRMLEEGDMIVGADGQKLEGPGGRYLLQATIISHDPGETMRLVIRRGAQKLDLNVPLGKFADLDQGGGMQVMDERLNRAWRIRAQARMGATADPVRIDGPKGAWGPTEDAAQRRMQINAQREANDPPLKLVGGGMPRAARTADDSRAFEQVMRQQIVWINGQARMMNMPAFRGGFIGDFDPDTGLPGISPQAELAQLLDARMAIEKRGEASRNIPANQKELELIIKQEQAIQAEVDEARAAGAASGKTSAADANDHAAP